MEQPKVMGVFATRLKSTSTIVPELVLRKAVPVRRLYWPETPPCPSIEVSPEIDFWLAPDVKATLSSVLVVYDADVGSGHD
jgi:hypothetical protein